MEGERRSAEPRRLPNLHQLAYPHGDELAVGAELQGADFPLEGHPVEHRAPGDVDEEAPAVLVDGHQESAVGGGGEAAYVGGGAELEGDGVVLGEVGDGDAVADGGDELGVLGYDGVSASVGCAE